MSTHWSKVPPRIRRQLRAYVIRRDGPTCALCREPIDLTLPHTHNGAYQLDHIVAPSNGGSLLDPGNMQPVHRRCNSSKQDREVGRVAPHGSTSWRPRFEW